MASIEMHDIHKSFGAGEVLRGCSLVRERGGVTSIIGPSGSGKSTFLRCLCHLETIDRGTIRVDGEVLAQDTPTGSRPDTRPAIDRNLFHRDLPAAITSTSTAAPFGSAAASTALRAGR